MKIHILLFDEFETLDIFGPVEILARVQQHELFYHSLDGGIVKSAQGTDILTVPLDKADSDSVLVIPGGRGTRTLVNNEKFLARIAEFSEDAKYILSVCTSRNGTACKSWSIRGKEGYIEQTGIEMGYVSFKWSKLGPKSKMGKG